MVCEMKKIPFFLYFILLAGSLPLVAQEVPVDVVIITKDNDQEKEIEGGNIGKGTENTKTVFFKAKIKNLGISPIHDLAIKIYPVAETYVFGRGNVEYGVLKVLEKKGLALSAGGEKSEIEAELGEAVFKHTATASTYSYHRRGLHYEGYAVEIFIDGKKVDQKTSGGKKVKDAFEEYLKSKEF
jgi:hypothetical protein